jgi:hypothetical protein
MSVLLLLHPRMLYCSTFPPRGRCSFHRRDGSRPFRILSALRGGPTLYKNAAYRALSSIRAGPFGRQEVGVESLVESMPLR